MDALHKLISFQSGALSAVPHVAALLAGALVVTALAIRPAVVLPVALVISAVAAIFEGALGEGAAAMEAIEGARWCEDPVVREFLLRVAEDEQRPTWNEGDFFGEKFGK